jgi:hypothetical protein
MRNILAALVMMPVIMPALVLAFTSGAFADDGLQRFEREIKPQFEVEKLSYRSGEPLGDNGFALNDVVVVVPPTEETDNQPSTVRIDKVTVEAIDFERLKSDDDDLPRFLKMRMEGITGDDVATKPLTDYGLPKVPIDLAIDYTLDASAKRLTLNRLDVSLRGRGSVSLALVMDGVTGKASEVDDAKESGRVQSASLTIDDKGLLAQVLTVNARAAGSTPESLVTMALSIIAGLSTEQDAQSMKAFDAAASFVKDWQAPQGPITIEVTPAAGASMADLPALMMPNALRKKLGLEVTYPGTKPGAASANK